MVDRNRRVIPKKTSVPGRQPTGTTKNESHFIKQGELAINTADKKLWSFDGSDVFEIGSDSFVSVTGGTINGNIYVNGSFTANTIYSGSTDLSDIISGIGGGGDITRVQNGLNTYTGGTANYPTVNVSGGTLDNLTVTGETDFNVLSADTIYSGSTNLYDIFLTTADGNDITRVQNGLNTYTGGTDNYPTVNISGGTFDNLTVTGETDLNVLSADTIYSGSTNLYDIFLTTADGNDITRVQNGLNTYTGGTANYPTVNISGGTFDNLTVTGETDLNVLSADTIYSGSTNLYDIFLTTADGNDITRVQNGLNTYTGGTGNYPTVNISGGTFDNLTVSGNTSLDTLSATTIYSGSTDLYDIFMQPYDDEPTGFPNDRLGSSLSFNTSTRVFTIAPTGSTYYYYDKGTKYTKNSSDTVTLSNDDGLHIIYFDGDTLAETTTWTNDLFYDKALVSFVYWNSAQNKNIGIADERHGYIMDGKTHAYLHLTRGTAYEEGLALGNMSVDGSGSNDSDAQFSVGDGIIWDEDLKYDIENSNPQVLSPAAELPLLYLSGSTLWYSQSASTFPIMNVGGGRAGYNYYDSGTNLWSVQEVSNRDFVLVHIFAINSIDHPVVAIMGQNIYTRVRDAREGATNEIFSLITTGLPLKEFIPVATIIYQTSNSYSNTCKSRIRSTDTGENYVNWLGSNEMSPTIAPTSHSNLSNLDSDDHYQYALLSGRSGDVLHIDTIQDFSSGKTIFNTNVLVTGDTDCNGVIYSGGTDLYDIFSTTDNDDITRVQNGLNTYTGGTDNYPTVNISGATLDNLTVSGNTSLQTVSATTIYSGSTDLSDLFLSTGATTSQWDVVSGGINYGGGNVGIGTTSPFQKLDVDGDIVTRNSFIGRYSTNDNYARFSHKDLTGTTNYGFMQKNDGTTYINAVAGKGIRFRENNAEKMILMGGKLGIGNFSPSYYVDIMATGNAFRYLKPAVSSSNAFFKMGSGTSNPLVLAPIFWGKSNDSAYSGMWFLGDIKLGENTGTTSIVKFESRYNNGTIPSLGTRPAFDFKNYTTSLMTIMPSGNVGIGTTTPNAKLQVVDYINFDPTKYSTFLGYQAGDVNTGNYNVFNGYQAGKNNTTSGYNTFTGYQSGINNTTGTGNVFYGSLAGYNNTTASYNSIFGHQAGYTISTGGYNNFFGSQAGYSTTTGYRNIFVGYQAGRSNVSGVGNTFVGYVAGYKNTANYNSFYGNQSGQLNTTGSGNAFYGYLSGYRITTGGGNSFFGGRNCELGGGTSSYNVAVGLHALRYVNSNSNTAVGYYAGYGITTGVGNTVLGYNAGRSIATGSTNTMIGYNAGYNAGNSSSNVLIGNAAGYSCDGNDNTYIGTQSGYGNGINSTGTKNIFLGHQSGYKANTSSNSTIIGYKAGYNTSTGSSNVFIGYMAGFNELAGNKLYIENSNSSSPLIYGEFDNDFIKINGGFAKSYNIKTANYNIVLGDYSIQQQTASTTVTLPSGSIAGQEYSVINTSSGNITLATDGSDKIGNTGTATTLTIATGVSKIVTFDGVDRWTIH